jgi:hypothetical protein
MRFIYLISISFLIIVSSNAQHKGDYNWVFGYDYTDSLPGTEGTVIDFNDKPPSIEYQAIIPKKAIGNSASIMSHPTTGILLFYSNGCMVFNADHTMMHNGDDINPGFYRDYYCDETFSQWYPIIGTLLSMEDTYHPDKYYFLHTPRQWPELGNSYCDRLMYSYIDMTKSDGLGEVVKKNEIYHQGDEEVFCAYTSVIKHANQKDWWVIHPILESNKFLTFLIDSLGPRLIRTQQIGDVIEWSGASKFSSDGKLLGLFNGFDGYYQYNFDRESGLLSTPKRLNLHFSGTGGGLAYSASSDFVYLSYRDRIYQVETDQDDLEDGAVLVDTLILFGDGQSSSFSQAQLGPDCKIYITHLGGVGYLGVINNPDEKGINCNLEQRGLDLAYFHDIGSIPNFPPFRVDEEDKCDNTISSLFPTVMRPKQTYFDYYPNPVEDVLKVLPRVDGEFSITNAAGNVIRKGFLAKDLETVLSLDALTSGVYYINMIVDGVMLQSEKLVKM